MSNDMIPSGGQSRGIVAPTSGMLGGGGGGFSETWSINKDTHVFVNKKTQESRADLYVIIEEMHPARAFFEKGERVCWSDDAISSHMGIECASCPHISEVKEFNKYYEGHPNVQRPPHTGKCSMRNAIYWTKEFTVNPDGSLTLREHDQRVLINVPKSSIIALWKDRTGYMAKLKEQGHQVTGVVTRMKLVQRKNEDLNSMYDYAEFESMGLIETVLPKVTKTVKIASEGGAPTGAPQGLPSMAGAPAAPAAGFPPATAGFPAPAALPAPVFGAPAAAPAAPAFPGFPGAAAATPAPGFPAPAAPGFGAPSPSPAPSPAPAAAPGFPGVQPTSTAGPAGFSGAPVQPSTTVPPAAAPAAPQVDFQTMARQKLIADFQTIPEASRPIVLNVLGVTRIEDVTNEKLIQATGVVASAKGFNAAPVGAGAGAGNPF